jgi:hypothetical protein
VGLERLKSTAELCGPVSHRWLGDTAVARLKVDGHFIRTPRVSSKRQMAEALLWLRDKERGTSPALFTLPMPLRDLPRA